MNIKNIIALFLLCSIVTAPLMSMNNPTFKEAQDAISDTIKKKYHKYYGIPIDQQPLLRINNNYDIQKIAENNIDQGILLEQHLDDLLTINQHNANQAIKKILGDNWDKQQKLMGLIECASFTGELDVLKNLIKYGFDNKLIPDEIFEDIDNTLDSFYKITSKTNRSKSRLIKELLGTLEQNIEYPLETNFDLVKNDINTLKHKRCKKTVMGEIGNLTAFKIIKTPPNINAINGFDLVKDPLKYNQQESITEKIRDLFNATSLPAKITLITLLKKVNRYINKNLTTTRNFIIDIDRPSTWFWQMLFYAILQLPFCFRVGYEYSHNNPATFWEAAQNASLPTKEILKICGMASLGFGIFRSSIFALVGFQIPLLSSFIVDAAFFSGAMFLGCSVAYFPPVCLIPPFAFLHGYLTQTLPHQKEFYEMKEEQKNVKKLIEAFKESIKKEYKL